MPGEFIISSVLSHHSKKFEVMDGPVLTSVTAQFYLASKGKYTSRCGGMQTQRNKEKRGTWLNFGSSFYMFFLLPLSLPCVNWDSQEGCLFYLRFSLLTLYLPLFYFWCVFSFLCFLATAIMDSLFLFQLPNIVIPDKITVQKCKKQMSF